MLIELTWVLTRAYSYSRSDVVKVLEQVLITNCFEIEQSEIAWKALRLYKDGVADFSDYCIAIINQSHGASHTVTFDRKAAKFRLFKLLE